MVNSTIDIPTTIWLAEYDTDDLKILVFILSDRSEGFTAVTRRIFSAVRAEVESRAKGASSIDVEALSLTAPLTMPDILDALGLVVFILDSAAPAGVKSIASKLSCALFAHAEHFHTRK